MKSIAALLALIAVLVFVPGCGDEPSSGSQPMSSSSSQGGTMRAEDNVAIARLVSAVNDPNHAMDKIAGLFADDFVDSNPMPGEKGDKAGTVDTFRQLLIAFPDLNYTVSDIASEGDMVKMKLSITGTNTGDWMGHGPTGKKIAIDVMNTAKVEKGKFTECSSLCDVPAMEKQLGMMEGMGGNQ